MLLWQQREAASLLKALALAQEDDLEKTLGRQEGDQERESWRHRVSSFLVLILGELRASF